MARDLDLKLLRAFEAVVRTGGVSKAAETLGRSQPNISQQLKKLEEQVGHRLFASDRSWHLTVAGELLVESAQRILNFNDQVFSALNKKESSDVLKIGVPEEFAVKYLGAALDSFKLAWPNVSVNIEVNLSRNLLSKLHDGQLDVVLSKVPRVGPDDKTLVWHENLVWVASENYVLSQVVPVPLVVFPDACLFRRIAIGTLLQADRPSRIVATCNGWTAIRASLLAGSGVTIVSTNFEMDGLRVVANDEGLPPLPSISVVLLRGPNSHSDPGEFLVSCLRDAAHKGFGYRNQVILDRRSNHSGFFVNADCEEALN